MIVHLIRLVLSKQQTDLNIVRRQQLTIFITTNNQEKIRLEKALQR